MGTGSGSSGGRQSASLNYASVLTPEVAAEVERVFTYAPWDAEQTNRSSIVRGVLGSAVKAIIENVPPCPDRTTAIRKLREASMDCNSAITFRGEY